MTLQAFFFFPSISVTYISMCKQPEGSPRIDGSIDHPWRLLERVSQPEIESRLACRRICTSWSSKTSTRRRPSKGPGELLEREREIEGADVYFDASASRLFEWILRILNLSAIKEYICQVCHENYYKSISHRALNLPPNHLCLFPFLVLISTSK